MGRESQVDGSPDARHEEEMSMKRYSVTVIMTISGAVEVDADSEEEAKEIAEQMDYDEWDEVVIDSTDTPYEPDYLTEVCDHCGNIEGQCVCECCEGCGQVNEDDCECDEDEEDEDDDED